MKIVTIIQDDPILGVQYGEQEINIDKIIKQKHINRYILAKSRRQQLINKNYTTRKK